MQKEGMNSERKAIERAGTAGVTEFCDWQPAGDEDACEEYIADEEG